MPPNIGVGTSWTRRSSGSTTTPERAAIHRASGVITSVTPKATRNTRTYESRADTAGLRPGGRSRDVHAGIGRELGAQVGDLVADGCDLVDVLTAHQDPVDQGG